MGTYTTNVALYGNVAIPRAYCPECKLQAFVIDSELSCCGKHFDYDPEVYKRESEPERKRRLPPKAERDVQLLDQNWACFYCGASFGSRIRRSTPGGERHILVRLEWDHLVPYSYSQDNRMRNFVAACSVCNRFKSNFCFSTVDEARIRLREMRARKGYEYFDTS